MFFYVLFVQSLPARQDPNKRLKVPSKIQIIGHFSPVSLAPYAVTARYMKDWEARVALETPLEDSTRTKPFDREIISYKGRHDKISVSNHVFSCLVQYFLCVTAIYTINSLNHNALCSCVCGRIMVSRQQIFIRILVHSDACDTSWYREGVREGTQGYKLRSETAPVLLGRFLIAGAEL